MLIFSTVIKLAIKRLKLKELFDIRVINALITLLIAF